MQSKQEIIAEHGVVSFSKAQNIMKKFGLPLATLRLIKLFFTIELEISSLIDDGHMYYTKKFSEEDLEKIIQETNLVSFGQRCKAVQNDKAAKDIIFNEYVAVLEKNETYKSKVSNLKIA